MQPSNGAAPQKDFFQCIVRDDEFVTVLTFEGSPAQTSMLTEAWKQRLRDQGIQVAPSTLESFDERLVANCDVLPSDDGSCMAAMARRLGSRWVLWGQLSLDADLTVQLVRADAPLLERHIRVAASVEPALVDAAWRELSDIRQWPGATR